MFQFSDDKAQYMIIKHGMSFIHFVLSFIDWPFSHIQIEFTLHVVAPSSECLRILKSFDLLIIKTCTTVTNKSFPQVSSS